MTCPNHTDKRKTGKLVCEVHFLISCPMFFPKHHKKANIKVTWNLYRQEIKSQVSFWGDENVLELHRGGGQLTLCMCCHQVICLNWLMVTFILCEFYLSLLKKNQLCRVQTDRVETASPKKSILKKVEGQLEFDPVIGLGRAYRKQEHNWQNPGD